MSSAVAAYATEVGHAVAHEAAYAAAYVDRMRCVLGSFRLPARKPQDTQPAIILSKNLC